MIENLRNLAEAWLAQAGEWLSTPAFYGQAAIAAAAFVLALPVSAMLLKRAPWLAAGPEGGRFASVRAMIHGGRDLVRPIVTVGLLAAGAAAADVLLGSSWLVRAAQSLSLVLLLVAVIRRYVGNPLMRSVATWIGAPVAALWAFGQLDAALGVLDNVALQAGNIRISLLFLGKAALAGGLFFWLGRQSNAYGQKLIGKQEEIAPPTRALFGKLFEIALFALIGILLLQVLGLDMTALTVLGGALGVGLGFGLQQIAANFISGIILLMERSMGEGDFIELEDGRAGRLSRINMRSSVLRTFDGKEILVPNETFITKRFVNWTREDPKQRYEVRFSVTYEADLNAIGPLVNAALASHPAILAEPEPVRTEIRSFGEFRVHCAAIFWVDGLDDGTSTFMPDAHLRIWNVLQDAGIPMSAKPTAQRPLNSDAGKADAAT